MPDRHPALRPASCAFCLVLLNLGLGGQTRAADAECEGLPEELFQAAADLEAGPVDGAVRTRVVLPNINALGVAGHSCPSQGVLVTLFPGEHVSLRKKRTLEDDTGALKWIGEVVGDRDSIVILTVHDDSLSGVIHSSRGTFRIQRARQAPYHILYEVG